MPDRYEVIIIGGGPAGCTAAAYLARAGARVLLLEARNFSQDRLADLKTGEVLSPGAQRELARLNFPGTGSWRLDDFSLLCQYWNNAPPTRHRLPDSLCYWQTDRRLFDLALLDFASKAGAEVRLGHKVSGVYRDSDGTIAGVYLQNPVETRLLADLVLDAGGRHSPLLARLGLKQPEPEFNRFAAVCFFSHVPQAVAGEWEQHFLGQSNTTLNGSRMHEGLYRYTLETDMSMREKFANLHHPLELFLAILEETRPSLAARFRQATPLDYATAFAPVGYRVNRLSLPGLLLVGDATGYLDPATGQGIEFALRTARLAAEAAKKFLDRRDYAAAFADYEAGVSQEVETLRRNLRLYLRATRQPLLLNLARHFGGLRSFLIKKMVTPAKAKF